MPSPLDVGAGKGSVSNNHFEKNIKYKKRYSREKYIFQWKIVTLNSFRLSA